MATLKQKRVLKKILENPSQPIGKSMMEVGYARNTAIAPHKNLQSSKGWEELVEQYLPDSLLVEATLEGILEPKKIHGTGDNFVELKDYGTVHKFVDTGLKIKNKFPKESRDTTINNVVVIPILGGSAVSSDIGNSQDIKAIEEN